MLPPPFLLLLLLLASASASALDKPRIHVDQTTIDFGKVTGTNSLSGAFLLRNVGDGPLELQPPTASCDCTVPALKQSVLAPGEAVELTFTVKLAQLKRKVREKIFISSNDSDRPQVVLEVAADYTPLYELRPYASGATLPRYTSTNITVELWRADTNAFRIFRIVTGNDRISALFPDRTFTNGEPARFSLGIDATGPLGQFTQNIEIYTAENTNSPAAVFGLFHEVVSEYLLDPPMLFWRVADREQSERSAAQKLLTNRVTLRHAAGKPLEVKQVTNSVPEVTVQLLPRDKPGTVELLSRLDKIPASTTTGKLVLELADPSGEIVELPITILVVWKPPGR